MPSRIFNGVEKVTTFREPFFIQHFRNTHSTRECFVIVWLLRLYQSPIIGVSIDLQLSASHFRVIVFTARHKPFLAGGARPKTLVLSWFK